MTQWVDNPFSKVAEEPVPQDLVENPFDVIDLHYPGRHNQKSHGSWHPRNPYHGSKRIANLKRVGGRKGPASTRSGSAEPKWAGNVQPEAQGSAAALHPDADVPDDFLAKYPMLANLGPVKVTEPNAPTTRQHAKDLAQVPKGLAKRVADAGLKTIHIGDKPMPDLNSNGKWKGVHPRGWPKGMTWDKVPGAFNEEAKSVVAGKGSHGSNSLVLHEYGHAVDKLLGVNARNTLGFLQKLGGSRMDPYYRQGKGVGAEEMFAEGFAYWVKGDRGGARGKFFDAADRLFDILDATFGEEKRES